MWKSNRSKRLLFIKRGEGLIVARDGRMYCTGTKLVPIDFQYNDLYKKIVPVDFQGNDSNIK